MPRQISEDYPVKQLWILILVKRVQGDGQMPPRKAKGDVYSPCEEMLGSK